MSGAPQGDQNHETVAQPAPVRFLNEKIYEINKTMEQIIAKAQEALNLMDLDGSQALQAFLTEHQAFLT